MKDLIGVKNYHFLEISLKQQALLFDKIAVENLESLLIHFRDYFETCGSEKEIQKIDDFEWLREQGFLFDANEYEVEDDLTEKYKSLRIELLNFNKKLLEDIKKFHEIESGKKPHEIRILGKKITDEYMHSYYAFSVRYIALNLRISHNFEAFPILFTMNPPQNIQPEAFKKVGVLNFIIDSLPIPDELTPWDEIFQFKKEPESRNKLLALRNWMSETARAKLSMDEIEEKFEWMLDDYQRYMVLQGLKIKKGRFEAFITGSAEFIENIAKLKLSKISKSLFSIKHRKINLLEAEMTAPGREISYIIDARERFEGLKEND